MLTIRRFQMGDENALSALIRRTLREVNYTSPKSELDYLIPHYSPETMVELSETGHTYVLEEDGQIIGSGTILDTSRLQSALAKRFFISPKNVHAHVYGEHGDSSFVPWSLVHIANNHIDEYKQLSPDGERITWKGAEEYEAIEQFVKTSGGQVIKAKGATFYAVAMSVCHLCKCVMSTAGTALTVSTMMHGEYGVDDVCLSTLALVDNTGVRGKILNKLTDEETARLQNSANKLKEVIHQITY